MGLDSIELLVEVETEFKISIPDIEAEEIITVGDFYQAILKKMPSKKRGVSTKCKPQKIFYELRNILSSRLDISKEEFSPKTHLREIFSSETIRDRWKNIEFDLGLKLPKLLKPKVIQKWIQFTSIVLIIAVILTMIINDMNSLWLISLPLLFLGCYFLAEKIFEKHSIIPQADSIRELIYGIISLNYEKLEFDDSNEEEIYWKLQGIISNTTGVQISDIIYEARIGDDLGID